LERLATLYHDRRVLVLGAGGFIGRWVAATLEAVGVDVVRTVRQQTAAATDVPTAAGGQGRIEVLDALSHDALRDLIAATRPAVTFNLVGYGVDRSERNPDTAWATNAELPGRLVRLVAQFRDQSWSGPSLVHLGSALEYGTATGDLVETTRGRPTTLYGRSKLLGTHRVLRLAGRSGVSAVVARVFSVYGPGEHAGRLLPALQETARTERPLPLTDGIQRRDFTYVGDVAEGVARLAVAPIGRPEVVNLATGKLVSVREFALAAARLLRLDDRLLRFGDLPTRPEEMRHDPVNIGRLWELARWYPATPVADGLWHTLKGAAPGVVGTLQRP